MALTDFKNQMCDKYTTNTLRVSNQLNNLHKLTRGPFNELRNNLYELKSKPTTAVALLNSKLGTLSNQMKSQVPDLNNNIDDVKRMAAACTPFKNLMSGKGSLTDAIKSVVGATDDMVSGILTDAVNNLMNNVSEYTSGKAMSLLDDMFSNIKIPDILGNLDPLINCLDNMCPGSRTSSIVDEINQIQSDMGFTDEGKFDSAKIMRDVGMPSDKTTNLTNINSLISTTAAETKTSASNQVSTLFSRVKAQEKSPFIKKMSSFF